MTDSSHPGSALIVLTGVWGEKCMRACVCTHMHVYVLCVHIHTHTCMHVYMYVCKHCVCVHTLM